jgi:hypothetical protein
MRTFKLALVVRSLRLMASSPPHTGKHLLQIVRHQDFRVIRPNTGAASLCSAFPVLNKVCLALSRRPTPIARLFLPTSRTRIRIEWTGDLIHTTDADGQVHYILESTELPTFAKPLQTFRINANF